MQTFRHFFIATFTLLLLGNTILYSQEIPVKNETKIPSKEVQDTISHNSNSIIPEINELSQDTVKIDTIKPKEEMLTGIIDYYGEDYVYMDKLKNKVSKLEQEIDSMETEKKELEEQMAKPKYSANPKKLAELTEEYGKLGKRIDEKTYEWELVMEEMDE